MAIFFITFVILLLVGVPISISIGASAVLGCLVLDYPMMVIGQKMVTGIDSYLLIAIPLFILAGNLMIFFQESEPVCCFRTHSNQHPNS